MQADAQCRRNTKKPKQHWQYEIPSDILSNGTSEEIEEVEVSVISQRRQWMQSK